MNQKEATPARIPGGLPTRNVPTVPDSGGKKLCAKILYSTFDCGVTSRAIKKPKKLSARKRMRDAARMHAMVLSKNPHMNTTNRIIPKVNFAYLNEGNLMRSNQLVMDPQNLVVITTVGQQGRPDRRSLYKRASRADVVILPTPPAQEWKMTVEHRRLASVFNTAQIKRFLDDFADAKLTEERAKQDQPDTGGTTAPIQSSHLSQNL